MASECVQIYSPRVVQYCQSAHRAESYLSQLYCKTESQTSFIIWSVNKAISVPFLAHEMSHFNLDSKHSAKSYSAPSAKWSWAWWLQTRDNRRHSAQYLRVAVVLLLDAYSCITICSRSLFFFAHSSMCLRTLGACFQMGVCVCVWVTTVEPHPACPAAYQTSAFVCIQI